MQEQAVRYLPVIRRRGARTTIYDFGRVVEPEADPICPICGREILLLAFDDVGQAMVFPFDAPAEREPEHRFDDLLPTPHAWSCQRDKAEEW